MGLKIAAGGVLLIVVVMIARRIYHRIVNRLASSAAFHIDAAQPGKRLWNPVSNANVWMIDDQWKNARVNGEADVFAFVEYVQLMQATGGSSERDLFRDPGDRSTTEDYDFSRLIDACRGILRLGAKPHIKLGSVPEKFCAHPELSPEFHTNMLPPDDFEAYYRYIAAVAAALAETFGLAEVHTWRWGVMTECNNPNWFRAKENTAAANASAYMKLYDFSVAALESVLGKDIDVGAHVLGQSDGKWDVEQFVRHCAEETNACTGETGTHLCYLAGSHYDVRPGLFAPLSRSLPDTVAFLRKKSERYGLGLRYGIDEGGILMGKAKGAESVHLASRAVGDLYQAGYDARKIRQIFDHDIDYVSSWAYLSGGLIDGIPTVSFHVAQHAARFAGAQAVAVSKTGGSSRAEVEAVAAWSGEKQTLYLMAYHFRNDPAYQGTAALTFDLEIPQLTGQEVAFTEYRIDDDANFFDEWRADRGKYGIGDQVFGWSPDDQQVMAVLRDEGAKTRFRENEARYREAARLTPRTEVRQMNQSSLQWEMTLPAQAVVFYEITKR